jgi:hypothetical protein
MNGAFEAKRLVSPENLDMTRTPMMAINEKNACTRSAGSFSRPQTALVWHNGGTTSFGSYVGLQFDRNVGVIVLSNAACPMRSERGLQEIGTTEYPTRSPKNNKLLKLTFIPKPRSFTFDVREYSK